MHRTTQVAARRHQDSTRERPKAREQIRQGLTLTLTLTLHGFNRKEYVRLKPFRIESTQIKSYPSNIKSRVHQRIEQNRHTTAVRPLPKAKLSSFLSFHLQIPLRCASCLPGRTRARRRGLPLSLGSRTFAMPCHVMPCHAVKQFQQRANRVAMHHILLILRSG